MELSKEKKSPTVRHLGQKYWRQFLTVKISAENSFSTPDFFIFGLISERLALAPRIKAHSIPFCEGRR